MLSIFICEDNPEFLKQIEKYVENYIFENKLAMSVACSSTNPMDVVDYLKDNEGIAGLYFLDLDLGCDINGIMLAEQIRRYDPRGFIVFITVDVNSYRLTFEYKVEAMDYIVKDDSNLEARIHECIHNAYIKLITKATPLQDNFVFKLSRDTKGMNGTFKLLKDSIVSIDSTKIMYFETSKNVSHNILAYTIDTCLEFRGSLSQIEDEMDKDRYYKCQRNLIINLDNVKVVDSIDCKIIFVNDLPVDISPKQVGKVTKRVREYKKYPQRKFSFWRIFDRRIFDI